MLSAPAAELQGRELIFQPKRCLSRSACSTRAPPGPGTAGSTWPGPPAATRRRKETAHKGLITAQEDGTLEPREEAVKEEVCSACTAARLGCERQSGLSPPSSHSPLEHLPPNSAAVRHNGELHGSASTDPDHVLPWAPRESQRETSVRQRTPGATKDRGAFS